MAEIRLGRYEIEKGNLPAICMRCGEPATVWKTKRFSWRLDEFFAVSSTWYKMEVPVPLCSRHRTHFAKQLWINLGFVALCGVLLGAMLILPQVQAVSKNLRDSVAGVSCVLLGLAALACLVLNIVLDGILIKPLEISDHSILLKRVSPEFAQAVQASRISLQKKPRTDLPSDEEHVSEPES